MYGHTQVKECDEGVMRMVRYDISRLKGVTKQKRAMSVCDAYRVWRSEKEVRVEFLDTSKPDEKRVRFRWIYELMPPFA